MDIEISFYTLKGHCDTVVPVCNYRIVVKYYSLSFTYTYVSFFFCKTLNITNMKALLSAGNITKCAILAPIIAILLTVGWYQKTMNQLPSLSDNNKITIVRLSLPVILSTGKKSILFYTFC